MSKDVSTSEKLHDLPNDMKKALDANKAALATWETLTPLTKNEWICWTTIVKKEETRLQHIDRMKEDLTKGKRRPCCWPGCPHRRPSAAKYFTRAPKAK
jgi:uncharacterized protein YdeI (YjbR/CyaY-like superfamily)